MCCVYIGGEIAQSIFILYVRACVRVCVLDLVNGLACVCVLCVCNLWHARKNADDVVVNRFLGKLWDGDVCMCI